MRTKILVVLVILIVVLFGTSLFIAGYSYKEQEFQVRVYIEVDDWTIERGIKYLEWARNTHISYIKNPDWCNSTSGDVAWNEKMVLEYQQLIDWLKNLKEGKDE